MTPYELLEALKSAGCTLGVTGQDLDIQGDIPTKLEAYLKVMHPMVRAILTGKRVWAIAQDRKRCDGPKPKAGPESPFWAGALDLRQKMPLTIGMMTVEGDVNPGAWHRVSPFDLLDYPELFETPPEPVRPARKAEGQTGRASLA